MPANGFNYVTQYEYTWGSGNRGLVTAVTTPKGTATPGDPNDYKTTFTYNAAGQVLSQTTRVSASESITTSSTYNSRGNLVSSTDGKGSTTTYAYDLLGRLIKQTLPDPDDLGGGQNGLLVAPVTIFV